MNEITRKVNGELREALNDSEARESARRAQVSAMVRFGGGLVSDGDRSWIDVELPAHGSAMLLRDQLFRLYGAAARVCVTGETFRVQVTQGVDDLARQVGIVDLRGRLIVGLPPLVVSGSRADAAAALRGAFLVRGRIIMPTGRDPKLELTCPADPAGLALIGLARRNGVKVRLIPAKRGAHPWMVVAREFHAVIDLLTVMGAPKSATSLQADHLPAVCPDKLLKANRNRQVRAALQQSTAVERALITLGNAVPADMAEAAHLRLQHPTASLTQLAQMTDPPTTKDTVASRLWRLLRRADESELESDQRSVVGGIL